MTLNRVLDSQSLCHKRFTLKVLNSLLISFPLRLVVWIFEGCCDLSFLDIIRRRNYGLRRLRLLLVNCRWTLICFHFLSLGAWFLPVFDQEEQDSKVCQNRLHGDNIAGTSEAGIVKSYQDNLGKDGKSSPRIKYKRCSSGKQENDCNLLVSLNTLETS